MPVQMGQPYGVPLDGGGYDPNSASAWDPIQIIALFRAQFDTMPTPRVDNTLRWLPDYLQFGTGISAANPDPEPRVWKAGWKCPVCQTHSDTQYPSCPNCGTELGPEIC